MMYGQPQLDQVSIVKAIPDVTSSISFGLQYEHLDFNTKNPQLADVAVRKAFATGLNLQEIVDRTVKQFSDKATILGNRFYMNGQPQYQDHRGSYGNGDTAAAEKMLTDAGYAKGADGIYAKGGKKLSFNISTTQGNKLRETQEQLVQAQAKKFGMEIKIKNAEAEVLFGEWLPEHNYDIANFAWVHAVRGLGQPVDLPHRQRRELVVLQPEGRSAVNQGIGELDKEVGRGGQPGRPDPV